MATHIFTDTSVRNFPVPTEGNQALYIDKTLPGFAVRVTTNGARSFILTYGSQRKRVTIGRVGVVALKDARQRAKDILAAYQLNGHKMPSMAFSAAREIYLKTGKWKRSTAAENRRLLERHFKTIETTALSDLATADLMQIIDRMHDSPSEAAHAFTAVKSFIRWSAGRGYSADLLSALKRPKAGPSRKRTLTDEELKVFFTWTPQFSNYGILLELLLYTGQRLGQFTPTFPGVITNDRILWSAEFMKGNRDHQLPLTNTINTLLSQLKPINSFSDPHKLFLEKSGIAHFTRHDLRRTFGTGCQRLGVPLEVTETAIAHRGTLSGVAGIYQRYDYFDEIQAAILKWQKHLNSLRPF